MSKNEASQMTLKRFISDQDIEIIYYKPSQVREIPLKQGSIRGYIPSLKPNLKGAVFNYESQLERDFLYLLDHDPNCIDLQTQPCHVSYKTKDNRKVKATPDIWAIFQDGRQFLFEVKPEKKLEELEKTENWQVKTDAIIQYCIDLNLQWTYQVITERKIRCVRLNNIKDMLGAAKHYSPAKINLDTYNFDFMWKQPLLESPMTFRNLVDQLEATVSLKKSEIISLLKYKIYYNHLSFDWNIPFNDASFSLSSHKKPPSDYLLYEKGICAIGDFLPLELDDKMKIILPSVKDQQIHDDRLSLISSIIENYGQNAKKSEIRELCQKKDLSFHSAYKWYLVWRNKGNNGLFPKKSKDLRKTRIQNKHASELLSTFIPTWNKGEWQTLKKAYEDYCTICLKQGIPRDEIPSDQTFRNWIRKLPAVEKRGKFKPSRQKHIKKGLRSTYQEGRYPGAIIQMDHTLLDIWLVDSFTKQPLSRPWITAGIDVFSRNIWGFYLSFEPPSQESVLQTIVSGLILKSESQEWENFRRNCLKDGFNPSQYELPCAGYPALIQVDNGKDFQAKTVKGFFMKNNITLEFRPTYTPNYGGFIESPWDTINDAIRGAKLPGRVFSMPKSRNVATSRKFKIPPRYIAKINAELTLDEFREWFFGYLAVSYCADTKASQQHSPNETWLDGLVGDRYQPMGGAVRIASLQELGTLKYLSKRKVVAKVNEKGLRYKNVYYTSKWFIEARKNGKIKGIQEFRVSHLDMRYAYLIDPTSRQIETLTAYNYNGDDRILSFLKKGLGIMQGSKGFPIPLKMLHYAKNELKRTQYDTSGGLLLMDSIGQKIQENKSLAQKDRRFLDTVSKTSEGRKTMAQAVKNIQEHGIEETNAVFPHSPPSRGNPDDFKVTFPIQKKKPEHTPPEILSPFYNVTFPIDPKDKDKPEHTSAELQSPFYDITYPIDPKNKKKPKPSKEKNDPKKNNH